MERAASRRRSRRAARRATGATLSEVSVALAVLAVSVTAAVPAFDVVDRVSLARSAEIARGHLARARLTALARRARVEVRLGRPNRLLLLDAGGNRIAEADLGADGLLALDSLRIRPTSIRYNARGQGSPGSLYLYRGDRGVRLVSNFLGRVRRQRLQF